MLKDYLLEAISLMVTAVIGEPTPALASSCVQTEYRDACGDYCGECGADKRKRRLWCYECPAGGGCYWTYVGCFCTWC